MQTIYLRPVPVNRTRGLRGTSLRGLADDRFNLTTYTASKPTEADARAIYDAATRGQLTAVGYWGTNASNLIYVVSGKAYAVAVYNPPQDVRTPAGGAVNSTFVLDDQGVYRLGAVTQLTAIASDPGAPAPGDPAPATDANGCPCRTETTVVPKQVTINVRQTRVICDTPPPTSVVPPCDEVTADVRRQLNEQGVQGLRGLADGETGGLLDLAFKIGVGIGIGYLVFRR